MKRTKINLAISREDYQKYELLFYRLKIGVAVLGVLFFAVFLIFFIILRRIDNVNSNLSVQKRDLLTALQDKLGDEAKIYYLQKKYSDINDFLKNDAASLPYYSLLAEALKESTQSSSIKSFSIDKTREASFTIAFNSFPELLSFFKFIESEIFLDNFEKIFLKSFTVVGLEDKSENYEISFAGTFIKL